MTIDNFYDIRVSIFSRKFLKLVGFCLNDCFNEVVVVARSSESKMSENVTGSHLEEEGGERGRKGGGESRKKRERSERKEEETERR